jgi:ATP-dependent DNA helicase RecG
VTGIDPDSIGQIKKDFITTINNPQKIHPPAYLSVDEMTLEGFREVASNILIHREYTNAFPAKLIIERGQVRTENSNKPHGFGVLNPETFTPFPKNPVIAAFFRQIGRADELGSGMRKLMRYGKAYGGDDPKMVEGDVFQIIVKVPEFGLANEGSGVPGMPVTPPVNKYVRRLLDLLKQRGALGNADMRDAFELKDRRRLRETYIDPALADDLIEMTIPDKPNSRLQRYRLTAKGRAFLEDA